MGSVEIRDPQRHLGTAGRRAVFGGEQGEMHELAVRPRCRRVASARPRVVALVITDVEVEPEPVAVERHGTVEIRRREHHGDQAVGTVGHAHILAHRRGAGPNPTPRCHDDAVTWDYLRSTYDAVAAKYEDRFVDELSDKPRDRELLQAFAQSVGDPVAEIGCGPGQVGAFVVNRGRRVIGVDLSPQMTRLASGRLDAALVADMRSLPFATDALGGLLAFYSVIHMRRPSLEPVLREFQRVLRPGGHVLLSAHEGEGVAELDEFLQEPVRFAATLFGLDELVQASRAAGLEVTTAEKRAPYASESTVRLFIGATKPGVV